MERIVLQHGHVNGKRIIKVSFDIKDPVLASCAKCLLDRKWDREGGFLYVPNTREHLKNIFNIFKGSAWVEAEQFLRTGPGARKVTVMTPEVIGNGSQHKKTKARTYHITKPCPEEYTNKLRTLNYSYQTLKTYRAMFIDYINFYPENEPKDLTKQHINDYIVYLVRERNVSVSYQNQAINAIKRSTPDFSMKRFWAENVRPITLNALKDRSVYLRS